MNRQVKKFFALPKREQWLFLKIFCLTGVVRLAILVIPFRWIAPLLKNQVQGRPGQEADINLKAAKRIGWIVVTASRYTPWESKCLVQAIVGKFMLRRCGIANTLYLGLNRDEQKSLIAHAWLRYEEIILTGGCDWDKFTIVGEFNDYEGRTPGLISERR